MKKIIFKIKNFSTKDRLLVSITILFFIMGVIAFSYSFFSERFSSSGNDIVIESKGIKLIHEDTSVLSMINAAPGSTITKTFTIENTSNSIIVYSIDWIEVVNTFGDPNDLVYTITSNNGGANIDDVICPISSNTPLLINTTINPSIIQTYTLTVKFLDRGTLDQTSNMNKTFNAKLKVLANKYSQTTYAFDSSIQYYTFKAEEEGYYEIELWGAQGGDATETYVGGKGGYTSGKIYLPKDQLLYFYIGERGTTNAAAEGTIASYNGGGNTTGYESVSVGTGGGATDVRLKSGSWNNVESLNSRIMVAGGGGGSLDWYNINSTYGGDGGNLFGKSGSSYCVSSCGAGYTSTTPALGGTQTSGGVSNNGYNLSSLLGKFGKGGDSGGSSGSGGSGYYGGAGGWDFGCSPSAGGGGSSFISGYAGVNAIKENDTEIPTNINLDEPREHTNNTIHYSGKYFIDGKMESGIQNGSGVARITYLGINRPKKTNTALNGVRYVKDCINGNSYDIYNVWVEMQVIKDGVNIIQNSPVSGISNHVSFPISRLTDGDITPVNYASGTFNEGYQCVIVDLANESSEFFDLDEIAVWHYWGDDTIYYYSNTTSVSADGERWTPVINTEEAETSIGKRINAWSIVEN